MRGPDYKAFGARIMMMRKALGMSQEALAVVLGISASSVTKWESGEQFPPYWKLVTIHQYVNVSLDWLISGEGEQSQITLKASRMRVLSFP